MKKLLLLMAIAVGCAGCPMDEEYPFGSWRIKNSTAQTLIFDSHAISSVDNDQALLSPGEYAWLYVYETNRKAKPNFDVYFEKVVNMYGREVNWQILSENGHTVLKTWNYADRSLSGQRFFNTSSWDASKHPNGDISWTFEILPEDINQ